MRHNRLHFLYPVVYLMIGFIIMITIWSLESDAIYAKFRMTIYQGAPKNMSDSNTTVFQSEDLKQALAGGAVLPTYGEKYGTLSCERIGLDAPVYYGDDDDILLKGIGQYPSGKIPGMGGSYILGGHDATYFQCLGDITNGDILTLSLDNFSYRYMVKETRVMDANEFVYEERNHEQLILYTCYPIGKSNQKRDQRLFVYCELQE